MAYVPLSQPPEGAPPPHSVPRHNVLEHALIQEISDTRAGVKRDLWKMAEVLRIDYPLIDELIDRIEKLQQSTEFPDIEDDAHELSDLQCLLALEVCSIPDMRAEIQPRVERQSILKQRLRKLRAEMRYYLEN